MTAKWLWGSTPIYVDEQEINREVKRVELFILDSTSSTFHMWGAGSEKRAIRGLVVGDTNKNALITDAIGDTSRTLTTPWGTVATMKINGTPKFTNIMYGGAIIDGTVYTSDSTALYKCDLELIDV